MYLVNALFVVTGRAVDDADVFTAGDIGDFALVNPDEKHQYRNKGDKPFKMICGVPKEFEKNKEKEYLR